MKVYYEEKTYEIFFDIELNKNFDCIFFPPGQALEGFLGFDAAVHSLNQRLWEILQHTPHDEGCDLKDIASEVLPMNENFAEMLNRDIEEYLKKIPTMTANLLFQYKKPEYITRSNGNEWDDWVDEFIVSEDEDGPILCENPLYYRYEIDSDQQALLSAICRYCNDTVYVLYAAPAIQKLKELIDAFQAGEIISSSNFTRASDLDGYKKVTYIESGIYSQRHNSPPQKIDNIILKEKIDHLSQSEPTRQDNGKFISNFATSISTVIGKNEDLSLSFRQLMKKFDFAKGKYDLLYSFLIMANFHILTGIKWLVVYETEPITKEPHHDQYEK